MARRHRRCCLGRADGHDCPHPVDPRGEFTRAPADTNAARETVSRWTRPRNRPRRRPPARAHQPRPSRRPPARAQRPRLAARARAQRPAPDPPRAHQPRRSRRPPPRAHQPRRRRTYRMTTGRRLQRNPALVGGPRTADLASGYRRTASGHCGRGSAAAPTPANPPGAPGRRDLRHARTGPGRLVPAGSAAGPPLRPARDLPGAGCPAGCARRSSGWARPTSSSVRSCRRARAFSPSHWWPSSSYSVTRCRPRRSTTSADRRGGPGPAAGRGVQRFRHRRRWPPPRSPRSTPPPCCTGEEVVVKVQRPDGRQPGPPGPGRHELDRPRPGRPDPGGRPGQPAGPGRAVRRDHRRGARLPARGRQHARHRRDPGRHRASGHGRAPAPPDAWSPAGSW